MANERFDVFLPRSGDGVHECLDMLRKWPFGLILSKITFSFYFFCQWAIGYKCPEGQHNVGPCVSSVWFV
ncbi:hypothetical protein BJX66DRAFT_147887 [Aspergillus keveii]|jgi:hypothetical protein|uniref:Uncharacterized protein n=1 Tax=Aspergillus keveii TaxID=714993 RepID=A0ABR4GMV8_9EURO